MKTNQNDTGDLSIKSLGRLSTLTDAVFALAMILLVIFIEKPPAGMSPTEENIRNYIAGEFGTVVIYLLGFINIAFYWLFTHDTGLLMKRSDFVHIMLTFLTLMFVGLLPYCNALSGVFPESLSARLFYSAVVFLVGLLFCADWLYAIRKNRLVDRSADEGSADALIVESLVQPAAALLSVPGALLGKFWWELPFLLVPFATFGINRLWLYRRKAGGR
jgi:uncharacterized membrane protein